MNPVVILAAPKGAGLYSAAVDGIELCISREPFLDACRALLARGTPPKATAVMRYAPEGSDCLTGQVGKAARLTIIEDGKNGPRAVRWTAPARCMDRPSIAATSKVAA